MITMNSSENGLHASTPAWVVYSWPPVLWQADIAPELPFVHLGTRVLVGGTCGVGSSGQTVWGSSGDRSNAAGVAWDWIEVQRGVVAMADPMGLVTNLTLLNARGEPIPSLRATLQLNELVRTLPWQEEVQRALARDPH